MIENSPYLSFSNRSSHILLHQLSFSPHPPIYLSPSLLTSQLNYLILVTSHLLGCDNVFDLVPWPRVGRIIGFLHCDIFHLTGQGSKEGVLSTPKYVYAIHRPALKRQSRWHIFLSLMHTSCSVLNSVDTVLNLLRNCISSYIYYTPNKGNKLSLS